MSNKSRIIISVSDFVKKVGKLCFKMDDLRSWGVYFRGEASLGWHQNASLFRESVVNNGNGNEVDWSMEKNLVKSAQLYFPEAFKDCPDAIGRLVKMQHYGLPTRLYDVTSNPLVALFFACNAEFEKDGVVLYTKRNTQLHTMADINILADLAEMLDYSEKTVEDMYEYLRVYDRLPHVSDERRMKRFLFEHVVESFLFQPPFDNERIKRQQGAMIFSALMMPFGNDVKEYKKLKKRLKDMRSKELPESISGFLFSKCRVVNLRNMFEDSCFVIESKNKFQILKELDKFGINEAFVYPELEHQMKAIKFKNLPKYNFEFGLDDDSLDENA